MKQLAKHAHHALWMTTIIVLIIAALLLVSMRLLAPVIEKQKPTIEQWTSHFIGQPVHIERLRIRIHGLEPTLRCTNVVVLDKTLTKPLLKIDQLDIGFRLLNSVFSGQFKLGQVHIGGVHLTVFYDKQGNLRLLGIDKPLSSDASNTDISQTVMAWILAEPSLLIDDVKLNWYTQDGRLLPIRDLEVGLQTNGQRHSIFGRAYVKQTIPSAIDFVINMTGDWRKPANLKAHVYVNAQSIVLPQWLQNKTLAGFNVKNGQTNLQVWALWKKQKWQSVQSVGEVQNLELTSAQYPNDSWRIQGGANVLWQSAGDDSWQVKANLQNVSTSRWQKIPGVNHLSGYLAFNPQSGLMVVDNSRLSVDFGSLFHDVLALNNLQTQVNWQRQADGWLVQVPRLIVQTMDVLANGQMSLWMPSDNSSPTLSLLVGADINNADQLADRLPIGIMSPALVDWLVKSIKHVDHVRSTVVVQGKLHDFPYDNGTGTFIIDSYINNAEVNYFPQWPTLNKLTGELIFRGKQMQFFADGGQIVNIPIAGTVVNIPELDKKVPAILKVDTKINGNLNDALSFIKQSPLQSKLFSNTSDMQLQGPMQLDLHLAIPLSHSDVSVKVNGQTQIQNAMFALPSKNIQLEKLTGTIGFTQDGIFSPDIEAIFKNKPVKISISKQPMVIHADYDAMHVDLTPQNQAWLIGLHDQSMRGQVLVPNDKNQMYQAAFDYIYVQPKKSNNLNWKATDVPRASLVCQDFRYGEKHLGQIQVNLIPRAQGADISLVQQTNAFSVNANGQWLESKNGASSNLSGTVATNDLAEMLMELGFSASASSQHGWLSFNLVWNGPLYDPSFEKVRGNLKLHIHQGVINNLGSNTQVKMNIGRLLNVLSLQSLKRRLHLDFSDLTDKGFSFDSLRGDFSLQNGSLYTDNLVLAGSVADVMVKGNSDLLNENYDLEVKIIPHLTANLPVIVGIAGGPIAGAATWVANKILSKPVGAMTTDTYRVKGPWDNPQIIHTGGMLGTRLDVDPDMAMVNH